MTVAALLATAPGEAAPDFDDAVRRATDKGAIPLAGWEYTVLRCSFFGKTWIVSSISASGIDDDSVKFDTPEEYVGFLNSLGRSGWELVANSATAIQGTTPNDYRISSWDLTFKRAL